MYYYARYCILPEAYTCVDIIIEESDKAAAPLTNRNRLRLPEDIKNIPWAAVPVHTMAYDITAKPPVRWVLIHKERYRMYHTGPGIIYYKCAAFVTV